MSHTVSLQAIDRDTTASITYRLLSGDTSLFALDPETGELRTLRGLDAERRAEHVLTVGTDEARMSHAGDDGDGGEENMLTEARVVVTVEDRNDVAPVFVRSPGGSVVNVSQGKAI